uniref:Uncharacterized protein n=1 Tax=Brassica oleracea TaxID=3712 RepID=A0A3P6E013_BRAOL|nr:unnamed protein product [Brassica oleracea]
MLHPRRKLLTLPFSMLEARLLLPELLILIPRTKTMTLVLWSMSRTCTLSTKRLRYLFLRCICRHILRPTKDEIDSSRLASRQRVTASRPSKYEEIWPPQVSDFGVNMSMICYIHHKQLLPEQANSRDGEKHFGKSGVVLDSSNTICVPCEVHQSYQSRPGDGEHGSLLS